MVKDMEQSISKQIRNAENAQEDFVNGVKNVSVNPIAEALKKNDKRKAGIARSLTERTWEKSMEKLSKEDWQKPTLAKADRYGPGVRAAEPKIRKFVKGFYPILDDIQKAVKAMPDVSPADRDKKMLENANRMRKAKGTWR